MMYKLAFTSIIQKLTGNLTLSITPLKEEITKLFYKLTVYVLLKVYIVLTHQNLFTSL